MVDRETYEQFIADCVYTVQVVVAYRVLADYLFAAKFMFVWWKGNKSVRNGTVKSVYSLCFSIMFFFYACLFHRNRGKERLYLYGLFRQIIGSQSMLLPRFCEFSYRGGKTLKKQIDFVGVVF